jgi:hypothetical protein
MILPDFILSSRSNQCWQYSGIDSLEHCQDQKHFKKYPYPVTYRYNSRGFRDCEWPSDHEQLKNAIWCVGDSFTVGIGSPVEHCWPYILQQQSGTQTINVSMDGASNSWMHRCAVQICREVQPRIMVLHWSYLTRTEIPDASLSDEQRRQRYHPDLLDTTKAMRTFRDLVVDLENNKGHTRIIHSFIPDFAVSGSLDQHWKTFAGPSWPDLPSSLEEFDALPVFIRQELKQDFDCYDIFRIWCELRQRLEHVPEFARLDRARDGHHYDLVTAQHFVAGICDLLQR